MKELKRNNNIFKTPENYFDKLPHAISEKVRTPKSRNWFLPILLKPIIVVPLVLLFIAVFILNTGTKQYKTPSSEQSFASIPIEDIKDYLIYTGVSEKEILSSLDEEVADNLILEMEIEVSVDELEDLMDIENIEEFL